MEKVSKNHRQQAVLSVNPIFDIGFIHKRDAMRDRRSLSLPRIDNKSLRVVEARLSK
jgi:hypothetical protein